MAGWLPNITSPEALGLKYRMASGTTTPNSKLRVLWIGAHLALVRWPGENGKDGWWPGHIELVDIEHAGRSSYLRGVNQTVHDFEADRDGRLTKEKLDVLIHVAILRDAGWLEEVAAREAARHESEEASSRKQAWEGAIRTAEQYVLASAREGCDAALLSNAATLRKVLQEKPT